MKRIILSLLLGLGLMMPAHAAYRGALMVLSETQTVPGSWYTTQFLYPQFGTTIRDTDGLIDNDPNSPGYRRDFVIPQSGVSLVEFTCSMIMTATPQDSARAQVIVVKMVDGAPQFFLGVQPTNGRAINNTTSDWASRSAVIAVHPGERYRCQLWQAPDANAGGLTISSPVGNWFQATIIE